jgi:hypothetical protein
MHEQPMVLVGLIGRAPAEHRAKPAAIFVAADDKAFHTLAAQYALASCELVAEVGLDGARRLYAIRNGQTQYLDSPNAARTFLEQIGGANA